MPVESQSASHAPLRADFRLTLRLALPLIIAEVGWMSMGIVDTIMVGRLPDSAVAIGATGLGQSLYHSIAIFGGGLLLGLDTFVAHAYGREDLNDARHSLVNGLFLAFALTPILMLARLVLAAAHAALRNQRGTGGADAPVPARAQLGHIAAARLLRFAPLSAGDERCASHHVRAHLLQSGESGRRLGADLRTSRTARHGHHRLRMGDVFCPHLHGRRAGRHVALGGIKTFAAQVERARSASICTGFLLCSGWERRRQRRFFSKSELSPPPPR